MSNTSEGECTTRGISEVFGVMLILAITIIVAGVVTAFAGGFSFSPEDNAISASIVVSDVVLSSDDPHCAYIIFDHMSGDPVSLDGIEIALGKRSSSRERTVIGNRLEPVPATGVDETGSALSEYLVGYGTGETSATRIRAGDRFVLYADGWDADDGIYWQSSGSSGRFSVESGDHITYEIIDTRSKRVISSGMVAVPEPS